ncbi:hypothetical protein K488DRAFT_75174 [Vararia minispora EC-137]|uniref:Uncharacterized protein n=1 Tax=Vararia minispora EC-137 TaxID=1314806 RepID=A0ACB8Q4Y0_9AGAM|nr:hypothetical protein K488DRAFT_75174 [Vararia minispora EC-137]
MAQTTPNAAVTSSFILYAKADVSALGSSNSAAPVYIFAGSKASCTHPQEIIMFVSLPTGLVGTQRGPESTSARARLISPPAASLRLSLTSSEMASALIPTASPFPPLSPPNGAFTATFCLRHSTVRSIFCSGPPPPGLQIRLFDRSEARAELKAASMEAYNVCPGCALEMLSARALKVRLIHVGHDLDSDLLVNGTKILVPVTKEGIIVKCREN